MPAFFKAF